MQGRLCASTFVPRVVHEVSDACSARGLAFITLDSDNVQIWEVSIDGTLASTTTCAIGEYEGGHQYDDGSEEGSGDSGERATITCAVFVPELGPSQSTHLLLGNTDGWLSLWCKKSHSTVFKWQLNEDEPEEVTCLMRKGQRVVATGARGTVRHWTMTDAQTLIPSAEAVLDGAVVAMQWAAVSHTDVEGVLGTASSSIWWMRVSSLPYHQPNPCPNPSPPRLPTLLPILSTLPPHRPTDPPSTAPPSTAPPSR